MSNPIPLLVKTTLGTDLYLDGARIVSAQRTQTTHATIVKMDNGDIHEIKQTPLCFWETINSVSKRGKQ